jgi:putative SOS response-associated peptidase YedK
VITSSGKQTFGKMAFGLTPEYAPTRLGQLSIRTDEPDNVGESLEYDRLMTLFMRNKFSRHLYTKRCVVLVDAFVVTAPDNTNYLVHMQKKERPFAIAGISDSWLNFTTGLYETGFAILTAASNDLLKGIGVDQMPVIISQQNLSKWLNPDSDRKQYFPLIHTFPDYMMNAYPVSGKIFSGQISATVLQPIGQKLKPDI